MIIHLAPDEKFIDMAVDIFEAVSSGKNEYLIVSSHKLKYVKNQEVKKVKEDELISKEMIQYINSFDCVVFHQLRKPFKDIIKKLDKNISIVWIGWGYDYYPFIKKELFLSKTIKVKKKIQFSHRVKLIQVYRRFADWISRKLPVLKRLAVKNVFNRIDYFSPVIKEDYDLLKVYFKDTLPKYVNWNYPTIDLENFITKNHKRDFNNILLGNSAHFENNHIEAIDILSDYDLEDRKVITPLSYGVENYKDTIMEYGAKKLGKNFDPLTTFLSTDEYFKMLSSCSIVIMNHLRQKALGNIIVMMCRGAKIFLNRNSPVYDFFTRKRAVIFPLEEFGEKHLISVLTDDEVIRNQSVCLDEWGKDALIEKTVNLLTLCQGNKIEHNS